MFLTKSRQKDQMAMIKSRAAAASLKSEADVLSG